MPEAIPTMSQTLSVKTPLTAADGEPLTVKLARERRNKQLKAVALVAPLAECIEAAQRIRHFLQG